MKSRTAIEVFTYNREIKERPVRSDPTKPLVIAVSYDLYWKGPAYEVIHVASKSACAGPYRKLYRARRALKALEPLTDWTQTFGPLGNPKGPADLNERRRIALARVGVGP